ncbi:MAG: translocation/assembly module TamB, partial [Endomicrobium sp.]|nr:translocation/assembly module TamB [Endomicrobium sp.]
KFNLKSGSGQLNVSGQLKLNNFSLKEIDINLVTDEKGIPLEVPQLPMLSFIGTKSFLKDYSFGEPRFDIKIKGSFLAPKISGRIILENTYFTFPGVKRYENSFFPEDTEFDLELVTANNTKFENSFISALINGSIHINGKYDNVNVSGIIETTSGRLDYLGVGFDIVNAKVEIINDNKVFITAEGETTIPAKTGYESESIKLLINRVNIEDLSKKDAIKFTSKDNPNMNYRKIFEKVVGIEQDDYFDSLQFEGVIGQRALRLLEQTFATPITRAVLRKIGLVDNFRVSYIYTDELVSNDQDISFANLLSGAKYSLEKNLTNQIFLGYSVIFDEFNRKLGLHHELEMKYKLANNLFLSGVYGLGNSKESYRPDRKIMLQHMFRFGSHAKKRDVNN